MIEPVSLGRIEQLSDGRHTLMIERCVPHGAGVVWSAIIEPDRLERWFGSFDAAGRARGTVMLRLTAEVDVTEQPIPVDVIECEPNRRLVVDLPWTPGQMWRLALTLDHEDGSTTLRLEQLLPPELEVADIAPGWHWYLDRLVAMLDGLPVPAWGQSYRELHSVYRVVLLQVQARWIQDGREPGSCVRG